MRPFLNELRIDNDQSIEAALQAVNILASNDLDSIELMVCDNPDKKTSGLLKVYSEISEFLRFYKEEETERTLRKRSTASNNDYVVFVLSKKKLLIGKITDTVYEDFARGELRKISQVSGRS